jgi:hypothetical protein
MIKTIHFGSHYERSEIPANIAGLLRTGAKPTFYRVTADNGTLEEKRIA